MRSGYLKDWLLVILGIVCGATFASVWWMNSTEICVKPREQFSPPSSICTGTDCSFPIPAKKP